MRFLCLAAAGWLGVKAAGATAVAVSAAGHWAFQPIVRPAVPSMPGGNVVDQFVRARLGGAELPPEADRRTLLRRLSFDLRGLPPSPAELAEFLGDPNPDAWSRWIDRFLASPQYGERWGRHWLDIAAYADSNGYFNADSDRPLAWKYRDYVVRSIQQDKPFDRFIQEQIAGDELVGYVRDGDLLPEMVESLVATQFLRNAPDGTGESDGNPLEVKVDRYTVLEGTVQLIGNAFLGVTLQCARCHDHKFEPVSQTDYYALQAILRPAYDPEAWLKPNERALGVGARWEREIRAAALAQHEASLKTMRANLEAYAAPFRRRLLEERLGELDSVSRDRVLQAVDTPEKDRTDPMKALLKAQSSLVDVSEAALVGRFQDYAAVAESFRGAIQRRERDAPPATDRISALSEPVRVPPAHHLLVRGNHAAEGPEVGPGLPVALAASAQSNPLAPVAPAVSLPTSGRRLRLARWLTSPDNPLVARVLVNRIWTHHFGQGLVPTADNLGLSGGRPSDPALLDWLAAEFMHSGWSLHRLHRLILTSSVWRARGETPVAPVLRRLDAEALRDSYLAVTGELDLRVGGPYTPVKADADGQIVVEESAPGAHRRSLYLQQRRTQPVAMLQVFDGPSHNPVCVQRVESTVALQSLAQLNSDFVRNRSREFAGRVLRETASEPSEVAVNRAFELAWGRPPTPAELGPAQKFLQEQGAVYGDASGGSQEVWTDFCQLLLAGNQFLYVE